MQRQNILIIGGGIGGLTSAIALGRDGHKVTIIEKDPDWGVYGVGIIQQANVIRAVHQLGVIDDYISAGFGFDFVEVGLPDGKIAARLPAERLVADYPANVGITRPALHKMLGDNARKAGADIHLGVTADTLEQDDKGVDVGFSDGSSGRYDLVIGADGLFSQTRQLLFPDAPKPAFTGQSVWRYNLPRPGDLDCLRVYEGPPGTGLVPLSSELMYMFVTTAEPDNPQLPVKGLAAAMRQRIAKAPPPIKALASQISDDEAVVYKPLEWLFLTDDWHVGRVVLLGDAVHGTTPHLGQGAGMAIEDSVVLAEEIARNDNPRSAFRDYQARRYGRSRYIVESSLAICRSQLGEGPYVDQVEAMRDMYRVISKPL